MLKKRVVCYGFFYWNLVVCVRMLGVFMVLVVMVVWVNLKC